MRNFPPVQPRVTILDFELVPREGDHALHEVLLSILGKLEDDGFSPLWLACA
jgi:hypothetical protein